MKLYIITAEVVVQDWPLESDLTESIMADLVGAVSGIEAVLSVELRPAKLVVA